MPDKRRKHYDPDAERALRDALFEDIPAGKISIGEAVRRMRRISRLTQPEFARHRGISLGALKQIEAGTGSPKIETLNKIAEIFGFELGFVRRAPKSESK